MGDAENLARVLNNLLKNAIAYSDPGTEIRIKARASAEQVRLTITNHGPTIPASKQENTAE